MHYICLKPNNDKCKTKNLIIWFIYMFILMFMLMIMFILFCFKVAHIIFLSNYLAKYYYESQCRMLINHERNVCMWLQSFHKSTWKSITYWQVKLTNLHVHVDRKNYQLSLFIFNNFLLVDKLDLYFYFMEKSKWMAWLVKIYN